MPFWLFTTHFTLYHTSHSLQPSFLVSAVFAFFLSLILTLFFNSSLSNPNYSFNQHWSENTTLSHHLLIFTFSIDCQINIKKSISISFLIQFYIEKSMKIGWKLIFFEMDERVDQNRRRRREWTFFRFLVFSGHSRIFFCFPYHSHCQALFE